MLHRFLFCAWLCLVSLVSWSQTPISNKIYAAKSISSPERLEIFQQVPDTVEEPQGLHGLTEFTLYDISKGDIGSIRSQNIPFITFDLQVQGEPFTVQLIESPFLHHDFKVINSTGEEVPVPLGKFYRGIIAGQPGSLAAFAFFEDQVMGVLTSETGENYSLGKMETEEDLYIFYPESALGVDNPFRCATDAQMDHMPSRSVQSAGQAGDPCKKVSVYIEVDHIMYQDFNQSMTQVTNFVTGIWNVSSLLYENEDVVLGIKTIKIWDSPDPYRKDKARDLLDDFSDQLMNNIDGDIGHILTTSRNNLGGLAWVDVLCRSYSSFNNFNRTAMSNIGRSYRQFPQYSWTVMVVTHEMGHNLGSHHTHRCVWGPSGDEALDNCEDTEGNCPPGPDPIGGGTIMSYCHTSSYGINFNKGFGPEPGDRIRNRIQNAACLGSAFEAHLEIEGTRQFYEGDSTILRAFPQGQQYTYQWYRDGLPISGANRQELVVKNTGSYRCDVNTNCTEVTDTVNVTVEPFFVSLGCPYEVGGIQKDSFSIDTIFIDTEEDIHQIDVPSSLHASVPPDILRSWVEMHICVGSYVPARLTDMNLHYTAPPGSNITDREMTSHKSVLFGDRCYILDLGDFDPTGEWTFRVSHPLGIRPNSPESYASITLRQKWELEPKPSDCDLVICEGDTAILDAGYSGLDYEWSTGAKTRTINVTQSGTYSVTVSNGDIGRSDDIYVDVRPSRIIIDTTVCGSQGFDLGDRTIFEEGQYTDTLISSLGCDSIIDLTLSIASQPEGMTSIRSCRGDEYKGIVLDRDTSILESFNVGQTCDSVHTTVIEVIEPAQLEFDLVQGCEDEGARILTTIVNERPRGNYRFEWSDGNRNQNRSGVKSGTVTLRVLDEFGCSTSEDILVENFDSVALGSMVNPVLCFGDSTGEIDIQVLGGTPGFMFNWSNGSTDEDLEDIPAGSYLVKVTDANGCQEELLVEVPQNSEIRDNATVTHSNNGMNSGMIEISPTGGSGAYSIIWSDGDTSSIRTNLTPGNYEVTITDDLGCEKSFAYVVKLNSSIYDLEGLTVLDIFPNPVSDLLNIRLELEKPSDIWIKLTNDLGHEVRSLHRVRQGNHEFRVDVSELANGTYYLNIRWEGASGWIPLILQR